MASVGERAAARLRLPELPVGLLSLIALVLVVLAVGHLLPAGSAGLAFRLAGAASLVLFLPGALILRALDWPTQVGAILAGSLAWSLAIAFFGLALTFAASGSLTLTIALVAVVSAGALVAAVRSAPPRLDGADAVAALGIAVGGIALAAAVWWASAELRPDDLMHVARVRKLVEVPQLTSVHVVSELRGGDLHPGYGFPLWHGALALIAKLGGVDPTIVVGFLPAVLSPITLVLAYGAGATLFRSRAGGTAVAIATVAVAGFSLGGVGALGSSALPPAAALLLLIPALLCLVFAHVRSGRRVELVTVGAAGIVLAVVHPASAVLVAVPLLGFLLARIVLSPAGTRDAARIGAALLCVVVPAGLYALWSPPDVNGTAGSVRLSADLVAQGGPAVVGALLAVPAAALAAGRRFAAFVLGGSLAALLVLLVPPFLELLSDLVTAGQARRLALLLPLPFALASGAVLVGALRLAGCAAALALGAGLQLVYPGAADRLAPGGPGWLAWTALGVAAVALLAGRRLARRGSDPSVWTAAAVTAVCVPVAVAGLRGLEPDASDQRTLPPALVAAVRAEVPPRGIILAPPAVSLRLAAAAPIHVVAVPAARLAFSEGDRPLQRRADVARVLERDDVTYAEKALVLERYGVGWVVVDKSRGVPRYMGYLPPPVYEDARYALYGLSR